MAAMLALMRTGIFSRLGVEDGQVHGFSPYGDIAALLDGEPGEDGLTDGDWAGLLDSRDSEPGSGSSGPVRVWVDGEGRDMSGPRPCLGTIHVDLSGLRGKDGHYKGADLSGLLDAGSGPDQGLSR